MLVVLKLTHTLHTLYYTKETLFVCTVYCVLQMNEEIIWSEKVRGVLSCLLANFTRMFSLERFFMKNNKKIN